jgi:hypothetical protein
MSWDWTKEELLQELKEREADLIILGEKNDH